MNASNAISFISDNLNANSQLTFPLNTLTQFSDPSSEKTLGSPSRGLTAAISGSSTTHSILYFRASFTLIQRLISWLFRRNNRSHLLNEHINSWTRSILSNFRDSGIQIHYVADLPLPASNNQAAPAGIVNNFQQMPVQIRGVQDFRAQIRDRPAAFDLMPITFEEYNRRSLYWASQQEMIGIRKPELERWFSRVQEIFSENKEQYRLLFEMIRSKEGPIREHCIIRKRRFNEAQGLYQAYNNNRNNESSLRQSERSQDLGGNFQSFSVHILEVQDKNEDLLIDLPPNSANKLEIFPCQYKERVKVLEHGINKIKKDIKIQDQTAQKAKKNLMEKYHDQCTTLGTKSLYSYELALVWEVRKQYKLLQSLKRALAEFIKGIRDMDEEIARILNLGDIMKDIYQRKRELKGIRAWEELQIVNNEKPLILKEKNAYFWSKGTLGKVGPVRVSLTTDKFLMVYKVSAESREPTEYAQFDITRILGRKEPGDSLVLIGRINNNKKSEFKIEFLCRDDRNQFLECYQRSYKRSFLEEEILGYR